MFQLCSETTCFFISCVLILLLSSSVQTNGRFYTVTATSENLGHQERAPEVPNGRPDPKDRLFNSTVIERIIEEVGSRIRDDTIRQIFTNCLPSTLDTTIYFRRNVTEPTYGLTLPYTYIITGDILAMWLRDSTQQVNPYIPLAKNDSELQQLILGLINTQAEMIELYPHANAYFPLKHWNSEIHLNESEWAKNDVVSPVYAKDEVWEAKYELDSLAAFLYLSSFYTQETGDASYLANPHWKSAVEALILTVKELQAGTVEVYPASPFKFSRPTTTQSETTNLYGIGNPVKRCGLVRSFFRPSDDSTIFQYLIPSNAMFVVSLEGVAEVLDANSQFPELSSELKALAVEIRAAITKYGIVQHPEFGQVYAYEVDGYGSHVFMDDGNFPSLLSLARFGFVEKDDQVYLNTRRYLLSAEWNPWYLDGLYPGIGSPHTNLGYVWHMSQAMQAMTTTNENEIRTLLGILRNTTAGTGFMHESYNVNNASDFSRSWFAWANSVFADLVLYLDKEYPHILAEEFGTN